jgi:release factor glutamine methyltransferase
MLSVASLLDSLTKQLLPAYGNYSLAHSTAWHILEHITKTKRAGLISRQSIELSSAQKEQLEVLVNETVEQHKPLSYNIGSVPFLDLTIAVKPPILIPRVETEYWCSELLLKLKKLTNKKITILDMCTGSGCIALSLAHALPQARVYALDISSKACALAQENSQANVIENILIQQSDLFTNLDHGITFDLIVTNPPYISTYEWLSLDPSVKKWEDYKALVSENNGLEIIEKILKQAQKYMHFNQEFQDLCIPQISMEIGYQQGTRVKSLFEQYGFKNIFVHQDLSKNDRIVTASIIPCK